MLESTRAPALEWAASGAMALTGFADGPPLLAPGPLASAARGAMAAFVTLARQSPGARGRELEAIDGPALLGERAAVAKLHRRGTSSPGGSCHLLRCADGWVAVNLARSDDLALLPAWLEDSTLVSTSTDASSLRDLLEQAVRTRNAQVLVERAQLLGLPVARACDRITPPDAAVRIVARGASVVRARDVRPLVIDLSVLWAGPLCAHLLELAGARVIKVESTRRPDGARHGPTAFYDLMNAKKESVALDFDSAAGRRALAALIAHADIVIESSRPRALAQLGIDADVLIDRTPGLVWVSITGYGRSKPERGRVAFGDDAGVAAGLAMALAGDRGARGVPVFCGDAIADPLAGLHAAAAALATWRRGESALLEVSLRDVAAYAAGFGSGRTDARAPHVSEPVRQGREGIAFEVAVGDERQWVRDPRARTVSTRAAALGTDTTRVLAELASSSC